MSTMRVRWVALLLAAVLALQADRARADAASEAQLQYELGVEFYGQRRYGEALERFLASNRLVANANVMFNVAQTYGLLRRPVDAYNAYTTYLAFDTLDEAARLRGQRAREALLPSVAAIAIETVPAEAELFLDRVDLGSVGSSPRNVATTAGDHVVIARAAGYRDVQLPVRAVRGQLVPARLELTRIVGRLVVESSPPGAAVLVQGTDESLGVTPLAIEHPVGELTLLVRLEGSVAQTRVVVVRDGEEARVSVELTQAASGLASLSVRGGPVGARVTVGGRAAGTVPLALTELAPGTTVVRIERAGLTPWEGEVVLEPSTSTRIDVALRESPSRPIDALRFVGYGLGAASVIAGSVLGVLALGAHDDFFQSPSPDALQRVSDLSLTTDVLLFGGLAVLALTFVADLLWAYPPDTTATVALDR
jgi:hypothetical protein